MAIISIEQRGSTYLARVQLPGGDTFFVDTTVPLTEATALPYIGAVVERHKDDEFEACIASNSQVRLRELTGAEFIARLRQRYRASGGQELARLAEWILARLASGDISDNQLRNAFGMTAGQYTDFKLRLQNKVDLLRLVSQASGE